MAPDQATLVRPAHLWVPDHVATSGHEAADLAETAGLLLDPEQRLVLDILLAEQAGGKWAAFEAAVIEPRQNGKTRGLQALVLADLFIFGAELIVWTAHLFDTAQEAFRDITALIEGTPHLKAEVKHIHRARGDEGIELKDGRRLNFLARSKTGGRGLSGDRIILDEAFALSAAEMGSLLPTLSARPNPQVVYASSAGMKSSSMLRSVRDRGRAGDEPSLAYVEWAAAEGCESEDCDHAVGTSGCALDSEERWREANPGLERGRLALERIAAERRALPPVEFARERLGWWEPVAEEDDLELLEAWQRCGDADAEVTDPVVFALDVAPMMASASIVACGGGVVEVVEHGYGASWVVDRLSELRSSHRPTAVGIDPAGPAGALIPDLEAAGLQIRTTAKPRGLLVLLDGRESVQACGALRSAVTEGSFVHRDQGVLNDAVAGASRREVGDAWKWSRKDSTVDISPLVAATVARFLWHQPSVPPPAPPKTEKAGQPSETADLATLNF